MTAVSHLESFPQERSYQRRVAIDNHPSILADIYETEVNIAIWTRQLSQPNVSGC